MMMGTFSWDTTDENLLDEAARAAVRLAERRFGVRCDACGGALFFEIWRPTNCTGAGLAARCINCEKIKAAVIVPLELLEREMWAMT